MKHSDVKMSVGEIVCLTLILTMVLYCTGLFTVNYVSTMSPAMQNMVYAVGRVPIIFTVLYFALKGRR